MMRSEERVGTAGSRDRPREQTPGGALWFICPDNPRPSGGVKMIYRFVEICNRAGMSACVVHARRGFRPQWFDSSAPVVAADNVTVAQGDLLVIPEVYGPRIQHITAGAPHVILNQGPYLTFGSSDWNPRSWRPILDWRSTLGIVTVSADAVGVLELACPGLVISRIHLGIDSTIFRPGPPLTQRPKRIAFMPRRRPRDVVHVLRTAQSQGVLDGWDLSPIDGTTEREVAAVLRSSAIFLAFGEREGWSLPPLEAMACGCLVLGFHGSGGREYMTPEVCIPFDESDLLGLTGAFVEALRHWDSLADQYVHTASRAVTLALSEYNQEREASDVEAIFRGSLARARLFPFRGRHRLQGRQLAAPRWRTSGHLAKEGAIALGRAVYALGGG